MPTSEVGPSTLARRDLFAPSAPRITPLAFLGLRRASRVFQRNVVVYRRGWRFIVSGFFEPFFYLVSIGLGLSKLVGAIHTDGHVFAYTVFVAPGLLAASAMNGAIFDCTFKIFFQLKIMKTYDSMLATPLGPRDVAVGELLWALARGGLYSGAVSYTHLDVYKRQPRPAAARRAGARPAHRRCRGPGWRSGRC